MGSFNSSSSKGNPTVSLTLETAPYYESKSDRSCAVVYGKAELTDQSQRVIYWIKWDEAVVPGGTHLNQDSTPAGTWVEDLSPNGESVGDRNSDMARYWNDKACSDYNPGGLYYGYRDPIQQMGRLTGGSWWFKLDVVNKKGKVLASS